ncbi:hypothetical protein KKB55_17985 [Myxococcota bacterium]|nr:hypothetical protein [Myxococcota bacterium]MBU1899636.1 hypothetical protein [Myxococcota bacterium]
MVTFGDLMSLLLTFFILLLSFSSMDVARFKEMAGTIKDNFGLRLSREEDIMVKKAENFIRKEIKIDYNARRILKELRKRLDPRTRPHRTGRVNIEIFETYRGVVILFPARDVFVEGTDQILPSATPLLGFVAEQIKATLAEQAGPKAMEMAVETRTTPQTQRAPRFEDAWALTAYQAVALARFLRGPGEIAGEHLLPLGRGEAPPDHAPGEAPKPGPSVEFVFLTPQLHPE